MIKRAYLATEKQKVEVLLQASGLRLDSDVDATFYVEQDGQAVATASIAANVIKCVAVSQQGQGQSLATQLVAHCVSTLHNCGVYNIFLFTRPCAQDIFNAIGFSTIVQTSQVSMLELSLQGITATLTALSNSLPPSKDRACIVANLNPITLGHIHLIQCAAQSHEQVVVLVVEEDKSFFNFATRLSLARHELTQFKNVQVLPSTRYVVSSATFPTYFLKQDSDAVALHAQLDAKIFHNYFVDIFQFKRRYVGQEPQCAVTQKYNAALAAEMPSLITVVDRIQCQGQVISASLVRQLLHQKQWQQLSQLVGNYTYEYLRRQYE